MIYRMTREWTRYAASDMKAASEKIKQEQIDRAMEKLKAAGAEEKKSRQVVAGYLRYLLFASSGTEPLTYHFMVHTDSSRQEEIFLAAFFEVYESITGNSANRKMLTETEILNDNVGKISDADFLVLHKLLSREAFLTRYPGKKEQDLASLRRKLIQFCEKPPAKTLIVCASNRVLRERFWGSDNAYFRVFRNHVYLNGTHLEESEVCKSCFDALRQNGYVLTENFEEDMRTYVDTVYAGADLQDKEFVRDAVERVRTLYYQKDGISGVIDRECIPFYRKRKGIDEIRRELDALVGLSRVKEEILNLYYMVQDHHDRNSRRPLMHMVFQGNPGTGKTTVAQMMADLLFSMRLIRKNRVVSVSANDLIGEYVGHTGPKTARKCAEAYGGILFIDEAYTLSTKGKSSGSYFREECLATLLQEMENNRDELIVIFAGYSREMDAFLDSNPGLRSRIPYIFEFEDYTTGELCEIFDRLCKKEGYQLTDEASKKVFQKLDEMRGSKNFGNGRTARNSFEEAEREYRKSGRGDHILRPEYILLPDTNKRSF